MTEPILKFYSRLPKSDEVIQLKIRESARDLLAKKKSEELLSHEELLELYSVFEKHANPPFPGDGNVKFMGFRSYKKMIPTLKKNGQQLLTTPDGHPVFVKLILDDPYMRVPIDTLFNYVMRKTWLRETRLTLSTYDETGEGFIKEEQLQDYIRDLVPNLTQLKGMEPNFLQFYVVTAAKKFSFFLDTNKTGKIKIVDMLASFLIEELFNLRETDPPPPPSWFSLGSVEKIYRQFMYLDKDLNGMLSPDELLYYCSGEMSLTPAFVNRIFQECITFEGELDYQTYLELVLAFENPKEVQSLKFFFRIMDIHHAGYLDAFTLQYFYKDIANIASIHNMDEIAFNDIKDEMFDMVKPADPLKITFQDILNCGCGDVLFSVFTDFKGFHAHEFREASPDNTAANNMGSSV